MRVPGLAAAALLFAAALSSCNNGDYDAYPDVDLSGSTSPIASNTPGANESFDWGGTAPMSAKIGGSDWLATSATINTSGGYTWIVGLLDSQSLSIGIHSNDPQAGTVYTFGPEHGATYAAQYTDPNQFFAAGFGSGGAVKITESDATHIKGLFYFNGKTTLGPGAGLNIHYGFFDVPR